MRTQRIVETGEVRSERLKRHAQLKAEEAAADKMIRESIRLYGP